MKHKLYIDKNYTPLTYEEYQNLFCSNEKIMKEAYDRAWQTRNFEIDKFWSRSAFFWGFIVLIFGGYITIMTSDNNEELLLMYFDIYLILLGIIFSFAWLLVIHGSKNWQENWEAHIDMLEDRITGPLYKTIKCHSFPYYSVSGINKFLSVLIICVWIIILASNLSQIRKINLHIIIAIAVTVVIVILLFALCRSNGKWKIGAVYDKVYKKDNEFAKILTRFIDRWEK